MSKLHIGVTSRDASLTPDFTPHRDFRKVTEYWKHTL